MQPGALATHWNDRPNTFERFDHLCDELAGGKELPLALRYFGGAGQEHMQRYGTKLTTFAKVRAKASRHATNNPLALFRKEVSEEDVMASPPLWPGVLTRLMACPPTCGAAAAILVSEDFARRHGLRSDVRILAQSMVTDRPETFETRSMIDLVGFHMAEEAAKRVYEKAGVGPDDIDVCELHDCFAQNELLSYEALGFCPVGGGEKFVVDGDNTYGGKVVTNPSGGLLSKDIRWAPQASRNASSSRARSVARPARRKSKVRNWDCSTTSGSVGRRWSPCTVQTKGLVMIDKKYIGMALPKATLEIEKGRLRFFAKSIGETDPIYTDETAAKAAGYTSLPAPPTFIFAAELDSGTLVPALSDMGVNLALSCTASSSSRISLQFVPATRSLSSRSSPISTTRRTARSSSSSRIRSLPTSVA